MQILGAHQFIDRKSNRKFVLDTQCNIIGGLSKWIDHSSDPLHSYLGILYSIIFKVNITLKIPFKGLAGLSVCEETDLVEIIHPALNVTKRAFEHWQKLVND